MGRRHVEVTSISIQIEKRKTLIFSAAALTPVVCVCVVGSGEPVAARQVVALRS